MARPLRVLSSLSRLGSLSAASSVCTNSCRSASRGASRAWMGKSPVHGDRTSNRAPRHWDEMSDGEHGLEDVEDVEDKLQALVDEGRNRKRTVKFHILRRQMTPPGPPQRKLTWDAIEQIRYLKQEQPQEWTVQRLAEGFSVSSDVILRVLRSKFVPTPGRKVRQDTKVMTAQQVLPSGAGTAQDRLKLPGSHKQGTLISGNREGALVPVADHNLIVRHKDTGSLVKSPAPVTALPIHTISTMEDITAKSNLAEKDEEDQDRWDGQVLTEEELEELMEMEKPSPVVQVGKEFFDAEGHFLYRI